MDSSAKIKADSADSADSDASTVLDATATKTQERIAFFILTVLAAPVLTALLIGSYGFAVWISQVLSR